MKGIFAIKINGFNLDISFPISLYSMASQVCKGLRQDKRSARIHDKATSRMILFRESSVYSKEVGEVSGSKLEEITSPLLNCFAVIPSFSFSFCQTANYFYSFKSVLTALPLTTRSICVKSV